MREKEIEREREKEREREREREREDFPVLWGLLRVTLVSALADT